MTKVVTHRAMLELPHEIFKPVENLTREEATEAGAIIRMELKDVLQGLGPIFGQEQLLDWCREIIAEDYDSEGRQTPSYNETVRGI